MRKCLGGSRKMMPLPICPCYVISLFCILYISFFFINDANANCHFFVLRLGLMWQMLLRRCIDICWLLQIGVDTFISEIVCLRTPAKKGDHRKTGGNHLFMARGSGVNGLNRYLCLQWKNRGVVSSLLSL